MLAPWLGNGALTKYRKATTMTNTTSIPVAPSMGVQGHSEPGQHVINWRAQVKSRFQPSDTLQLIDPVCRWRLGSKGRRFFDLVLSKNPARVQEALDLAAKCNPPIKAAEVNGHLAWLYSAGGRLLVNGQPYPGTGTAPAPKAKAPAKTKGKVAA